MASLSCQANGTKVIQFIDTEGRRRTLRLGKTSKRNAEKFKLKLESLISARSQGHSPDEETTTWLTKLDKQLLERLARVGLVAKPSETLIVPFVENYLGRRASELKPATLENHRQAFEYLKEFAGADGSLREFTMGDATNFRQFLRGKGLAENTTRKNCGIVKQFFAHAIEHELILKNPFQKVPTRIKPNRKNKAFVSQEDIIKVIEACPNAEMRAIVALSRFGGVRIPSEINGLKWEHIQWDESRIILPSPKTERHEGRDRRVVPLFPELRPYLEDLWEPGAEFVCETYRHRKFAISTAMVRAIELSGVKQWPTLFHSLRSSRETELEEQFPSHVVCAWLGNTEKIAQESYLQVTEEHFSRALQSAAKPAALQNALQNPARTGHAPKSPEERDENMVHSGCVPGALNPALSDSVKPYRLCGE